jgi:RNA-binding protein
MSIHAVLSVLKPKYIPDALEPSGRMSTNDLRRRAHDLDVTVWVGKAGIDPVVDELDGQLKQRELVKVKFLRAARGGTTTEELAEELATRANADVFETRGHTAVMRR